MAKYLMLMRHGQAERAGPIAPQEQMLSAQGKQETESVATTLADVLKELPEAGKIYIGEIWCGKHRQTVQTAEILQKTLNGCPFSVASVLTPCGQLDPETFGPYGHGRGELVHRTLLEKVRQALQALPAPTNAMLIVGHQPLIGWMAFERTGKPGPITRSELVCIKLETGDRAHCPRHRRGRLLWTLASEDDETLKDLRDKIRAKMDVAKLLGVLIIAVLGWTLVALLDPSKLRQLAQLQHSMGWLIPSLLFGSLWLLLLSLGLYLATMYAYDRLLMPVRFWGEEPPRSPRAGRRDGPKWSVRRPPSSSAWVLYRNMIHVWRWIFVPATLMVFGGLACIAGAVVAALDLNILTLPSWVAVLAMLGVMVIPLLWYWACRPRLGVED